MTTKLEGMLDGGYMADFCDLCGDCIQLLPEPGDGPVYDYEGLWVCRNCAGEE